MHYLIFDCETGGITPDFSLLTVYFMVVDHNFEYVDEIELLVKPDDEKYILSARAMEVNQINLVEHDKTALTEKEAATKLYQFLKVNYERAQEPLIPVGHNVKFDTDFVTKRLLAVKTWQQFVSYRSLDTGIIARYLQILGKIPSDWGMSLQELRTRLDVQISHADAHTAFGDVLVTWEILKRLMKLGL